jgi:DNA-binding response OmpR family regulator
MPGENDMRKILIVDELSTLSKVYVDLLLKNYVVEAGIDPNEILPRARRLDPDLVIINSDLPGFDPHQFCSTFRDDLNIPILLLLDAASTTRTKIDGCKADEVITKPFTKDLFFEAVNRLSSLRHS